MNITRQTLLLGWGLTVTGAYLLTEYFGHALEEPHSAILWTWAGTMLLPVVLTLALGRRANALVWVWAGATALAMLENFGAHAAEAKPLMQFSFHALWFLFGAAGFAYTAVAVKGTARKQLYAGAAILNLLGAIMVGLNPDFLKGYQYLVLALIQGVPMLLDLPLRRRHEAQANQ
ncbi:hypothetical protein [Hymenobacter defluvii]|uniref:Uncharacterized protein n=1 Tax=Hymenobacter defluvii TaxID=2054411 RepID=A0ABS3TEN1_9BACT|nr:hypothetical protein [Hymenobacter defluvii]MBO3272112.1 hypothetical protein [Hymenobacter defluvii]